MTTEEMCGCEEGKCGCETTGSCEEGGCGCSDEGCGSKTHETMAMKMMMLSHQAWTESLKEKIKIAIEKKSGAKLDKVADIAADVFISSWEGKMEAKADFDAYEKKLKEAMQ